MTVPVLVIDASVAAKWYLPEQGSELAAALLDRAKRQEVTMLAPELLAIEVANAAWQRVRRGEMEADRALRMVRNVARVEISWANSLDLIEAAAVLALRYGCSIYDAIYLALAEAHDCRLITADRRLAEMVPEPWRERRVVLLSELAE